MNMAIFKIIALRVLDGCPSHFKKCLDDNKTYFFDNGYEDDTDSGFIRKKDNDGHKLRLYDVKGHEDRTIRIELSAVVGKNGEGKSTLIELMLRVLNNFSCTTGFRASQETLCYIKGIRACLYYVVENSIFCIRCDDHGIRWYEGKTEIIIPQGTSQERKSDIQINHREQLFYTLVNNYALYAYNSNLFAHETTGRGSWLDGLFHKNDSYQTPLVLNPMRTNGNININKELDLSEQRLMTIFTEAGKDKIRRIVSDGVEAYGFAFTLEKEIRLLDVTLQKYFEDVENDECRMTDGLEADAPEEAAKEMLEAFHWFFSSFNRLMEKNDSLLRWLSYYDVGHPPKRGYTDLAKYVDIITRAYEEEKDEHPFDMTEELRYFTPVKPLRWMNYAQLYRLLFVFAVWDVLKELNIVRLGESLEEYISEKEKPTNKVILYIAYKIIEILSTYEPYRRKGYHYDANCDSMKSEWPTANIKESLRDDIKSILGKDDYTTLKLHQAINYLKEQQGSKYQAKKIEKTAEGYEWFVTFEDLKTAIKGDGMRLSELAKHLPPPVFKGEIMLKNEKGDVYGLSTISSGQMQRLNSAGSLVYHLRNLDYRLTELQRLEYDYVAVVFEEVELYFHPEFQRTLVNYFLEQIEHAGLRNIKGIHLIYVTHSPFILTDLVDNNVMYLSKDDKKKPDERTFAANIYDLLNSSFYMDDSIGELAKRRIEEVVKSYHMQVGLWKIADSKGEERKADPNVLRLWKDEGNIIHNIISVVGDDYLREEMEDMRQELEENYRKIGVLP